MKVEKLTSNTVKYTFDVTAHEFEHGLDHAFDHVQKDVEIKGFRKGHVPRNIYETKFGVESLFEDALNHVLHHKYHEAQNHPEFEIVGQPDIDIDWKNVKRGETFSVSIVAPVKPEVTLGQYKGIEVDNVETAVSDEEVDQAINKLLSQNSELSPKEGALELGDTAIFDFEGFLDGTPFEGGKAENYQLEIGSNQFIPGFESQMVGLNAGDEKDINVTFPENYQAENLAGKPVVFKIKLHEVKSKAKAELSDAFVASLDKENVKTVDELKASTRADLEKSKAEQAKNQIAEQAISKLIESSSMDIPQIMIDEEIDAAKKNVENQAKQYGLEMDMFLQLSGVDKETFEAQLKVESEKRVKTTLVIEAIAKKETFEVLAEELVTQYEELSKRYNMPVEEIKKHIPEAALKQDVTLNKAYQFVIDSVVKK